MRLPPFGRQVKPFDGEIRVYVGSLAWKNARIRNAYVGDALALPNDASPDAFTWPVCGASVLVLQAGELDLQFIPLLANVLAHAGATVVRFVHGNQLTIYRVARRAAA